MSNHLLESRTGTYVVKYSGPLGAQMYQLTNTITGEYVTFDQRQWDALVEFIRECCND